jgi:hypothetical protein
MRQDVGFFPGIELCAMEASGRLAGKGCQALGGCSRVALGLRWSLLGESNVRLFAVPTCYLRRSWFWDSCISGAGNANLPMWFDFRTIHLFVAGVFYYGA